MKKFMNKRTIIIITFSMFLIATIAMLIWPKPVDNKVEFELKQTEIYESPSITYTSEPLESSVVSSNIDEIDLSDHTEESQVEVKEEPVKTEKKKETPKKENTKKEKSNESNAVENSGNIKAIITHYCACSKCNGKYSRTENGINYTSTASGITLHDGISGNYCAATFGKLGDIVTINGVDYKIVDRMGGNDGKRIDIFVADGHAKCNELGRYTADVVLHD